MTPLERAARALWVENGRPYHMDEPSPSMAVPEQRPDWQRFVPQARAVLMAIREPSEAMVQAWLDAPLDLPEGVSFEAPAEIIDPYHARSDWRAMIDAALEEG